MQIKEVIQDDICDLKVGFEINNFLQDSIMKDEEADKSTLREQMSVLQTELTRTWEGLSPYLLMLLPAIPYLQFLRFSFDDFSHLWFGSSLTIFAYLDFATYLTPLSIFFTIPLPIFYVLLVWLLILMPKLRYPCLLALNKALLLLFYVLYSGITGHLGSLIKESEGYSMEERIGGLVVLALFQLTYALQAYLNFDFVRKVGGLSLSRTSNISVLSFMVIFLINILKFNLLTHDDNGRLISLVIMNISVGIHTIIFLIKREQQDFKVLKVELCLILINLLAVIMTDCLLFLNIKVRFSLWIILSLLCVLFLSQLQLFHATYILENINKWNSSQSVMTYTKDLRDLLYYRYDGAHINFYEDTLLYGYIEIHQQKCEEPKCPTKIHLEMDFGPSKTEQLYRMEEMIKLIYTDGSRMTPTDPELQLEFAIFLYEFNMRERALKMILSIKKGELPFHSYYKYYRLKREIHEEMLEEPNQSFLNILSELHLKGLQEEIIKKFQQAALINLEFWSVLNEDHPDFQKLNEVGKSRVQVSDQVHQLYERICQLAYSQRITDIYVCYLTYIQNGEELYNDIYEGVQDDFELKHRILIENWSTNSEPIILISLEDNNYGDIIDVNSTGALIFGYEKYELLNRHYRCLFSEQCRDVEVSKFLNFDVEDSKSVFIIEHKNEYVLKIKRKIKNYSSMETGLTAFVNIIPQNSVGSCFMLFNSEDEKFIGLSSSCVNMINMEKSLLQQHHNFSSLFSMKITELTVEREQFPMEKILNTIGDFGVNDNNAEEIFLVHILKYGAFFSVDFIPFKQKKTPLLQDTEMNLNNFSAFSFDFHEKQGEFFFLGEQNQEYYKSHNDFFFSLRNQKTLEKNEAENDYANGISTLRLHENFIKVIEESEEDVGEDKTDTDNQTNIDLLSGEKIGKKDEESIFYNRKSYKKFLNENQTRNFLKPILLIGISLTIALYIANLFLFSFAKDDLDEQFENISIDNIVIGYVARIQSLTYRWQLQASGRASQQGQDTQHEFEESIEDLNLYKESYSTLDSLNVAINNNKQEEVFLTDEFLFSYENTAKSFLAYFQKYNNQTLMQDVFERIDPQVLSYLRVNGNSTKEQMAEKATQRVNEAQNLAEDHNTKNISFLIGGFVLQVLFAIIMMCLISRRNLEKIDILDAFLNVTEHQIQYFSAKTERFLITLHGEEAPDDFDDGPDAGIKKKETAMFLRKKRFKIIRFSRIIYLKMMVVPVLACAFCTQFFFLNYDHINFMKASMKYSYLQSKFTDIFFTGLSEVQQEIIRQTDSDNIELTNSLSALYLEYYRLYFSEHFNTFGNIDDFHELFTNIFMYDICKGNTKIFQACNIENLSSKGALLIFTDVSISLQQADFTKDFDHQFYMGVEVLMHSHEKLFQESLKVEKQLSASVQEEMLIIFCCWTSAVLIVGLLYGISVVNSFVAEITVNKNMLVFFPVSVARNLPQINKYIAKILQNTSCC